MHAVQGDQASALCKDKMQEASDIKFPTVMLFWLMPNLEAEEVSLAALPFDLLLLLMLPPPPSP